LRLPVAARAPISAALGADSAIFRIADQQRALSASNPAQRLSIGFASAGIHVASGATRVGLSLRAVGFGGALKALGRVAPSAHVNRVRYARGNLSEWYLNGPLGLEQGFTIARRPADHAAGPLTLSIALSGNARAALSADGQSVTFSHASGPALRYGGLTATDARGSVLHSWLTLSGGLLMLRVNTNGAHYPLRIDPLLQQAELTASGGQKGDYFGSAVAVSGNTIVVGAYQYNSGKYEKAGKAYVFVRPASGWANATQAAELKPSDGEAARANPDGQDEAALFGKAVAIDGDTIVVGAPEWQEPNPDKNFIPGAAYVFVKPTNGWSGSLTQNAELHPDDGSNVGGFGIAVAVSGDTVFVASQTSEELSTAGAVYVYEKPGGGWSGAPAQTAKLTTLKASASATVLVGMAASGDTVVAGGQVIGSPDHQEAYVWVRPGGGWANAIATARLVPPTEAETDRFGEAVAISGNTVVVGAPWQKVATNPRQGAAYVFEEPSAGGWVSDQSPNAELTESDAISGFSEDFGISVGIAGKTIVVGDPTHYSTTEETVVGAADVFEDPAGGWTSATQTSELTTSLGPDAEIGYAVAVDDEEAGVEVPPTIVGGSEGTKIGSNFEQGDAFVFGAHHTEEEPVKTETSKTTELTTYSSANGPSGSGAGGSSGGVGAAPAPPALSGVSLANKRFRVAKGATAISAKAPLGTTFMFTLSAAAKLQIAITQTVAGLRHGNSCVAPTAALRHKHAKSCTRAVKVGSLTRAGEPAAADSVVFTGRIGSKALAVGDYSAALTASNAGGSSATAKLTFDIVH
jgi:hypothetical protein